MRSRSMSTWGYAPLPLLPHAVRRRFAHLNAPKALARSVGVELKLEDLDGRFWESHSEVSTAAATEITRLFASLVASCSDVPLCESATVRSIELASMPLCARSRGAFRRAIASDRIELNGLSFRTLLTMPGIGVKRVRPSGKPTKSLTKRDPQRTRRRYCRSGCRIASTRAQSAGRWYPSAHCDVWPR